MLAELKQKGIEPQRIRETLTPLSVELVLTAHPDLHRPTASRMRRILCLRCATGSPVSLATAHLRVAVGAKMMPSPRRSTL